jgi:hypothetical protein
MVRVHSGLPFFAPLHFLPEISYLCSVVRRSLRFAFKKSILLSATDYQTPERRRQVYPLPRNADGSNERPRVPQFLVSSHNPGCVQRWTAPSWHAAMGTSAS